MINRPIPTEYHGVVYRSELEAIWAAFFELLGWFVKYEAVDAWWYIPDFKINQGWQLPPLEVKDVGSVAELIRHENKVHHGMNGGDDDAILVGNNPTIKIKDERHGFGLYTTGISTEYGHTCGRWNLYIIDIAREHFLLPHCLPEDFKETPGLRRMRIPEMRGRWEIAIANVKRDGTRAITAPPTYLDAKRRMQKQRTKPRKISGDDQINPA